MPRGSTSLMSHFSKDVGQAHMDNAVCTSFSPHLERLYDSSFCIYQKVKIKQNQTNCY